MPAMTPDQKRTRARVEGVMALIAPALDLVVHPSDHRPPRLDSGTR